MTTEQYTAGPQVWCQLTSASQGNSTQVLRMPPQPKAVLPAVALSTVFLVQVSIFRLPLQLQSKHSWVLTRSSRRCCLASASSTPWCRTAAMTARGPSCRMPTRRRAEPWEAPRTAGSLGRSAGTSPMASRRRSAFGTIGAEGCRSFRLERQLAVSSLQM